MERTAVVIGRLGMWMQGVMLGFILFCLVLLCLVLLCFVLCFVSGLFDPRSVEQDPFTFLQPVPHEKGKEIHGSPRPT